MVYVTHDQIEAMTLATKIVILNKGVVQQMGTPHEIYFNPANLFVARFIGSPPITLIDGGIEHTSSATVLVTASGAKIALPARFGGLDSVAVTMGLRPENIGVVASEQAMLTATVDLVEPTGPEDIVTLNIAGQACVIRTPAGAVGQSGSIGLQFDLDKALFFDRASGNRAA
jgi:multiple sugar transport system ATP-binding protein